MPFEEFKVQHPHEVVWALRELANAISMGYVECTMYDIAGEHPSQPRLAELTLYLKDTRDSRSQQG